LREAVEHFLNAKFFYICHKNNTQKQADMATCENELVYKTAVYTQVSGVIIHHTQQVTKRGDITQQDIALLSMCC